jgi:predicted metal-dependent phosphoesterase TrpH
MSVDLHLHTHYSDGTWSPEELVEHAVKIKLRHIAVTDHDTVEGIAEAKECARGRLEIINAVEVNTVHKLGDGTVEDIHILGYFIDPCDRDLDRLLKCQRQARLVHAQECIERIASSGVPITLDMVQKHAGRGSIGKVHLTRALIEAGAAGDAGEAYDKYLKRGSEYFIERLSVVPEDAIRAITGAGGIASIAHPGRANHIFDLILRLKQAGLGAIEAYHRMHSVDRTKQYVRFANRHDLLLTGGSDCHGPFGSYASTAGSIPVPLEVVEKLRAKAQCRVLPGVR